MSISIEVSGLQEAEDYFAHASESLVSSVSIKMSQIIQEMADYARSIAPVKTGEYANSIHVEQDSELVFRLVADSPHAVFIELGTAPHAIIPRNAKALKFEADGDTVFAKYVFHPGTPAQLIIHTAKKQYLPQLVEVIRAGVAEALKA